mgnify:CR=1 FL=1
MYKNLENGRSMIEMLGVLAIIAVLSVGGISGYSKAMTKFKINKAVEGYTYIIWGIVEHLNEFINQSVTADNGMVPLVEAYGLIPQNWIVQSSHYIKDNNGNRLHIFRRSGTLTIDFDLDAFGISGASRKNYCITIFQQIVQPLHSIIDLGETYYYTGTSTYYEIFGDKSCRGNRKCLKSASISDFEKACSICENQKSCVIVINF